ncbi:peptidoglycan DD-metalloendopeptidase family protein [Frigidibacter albus]|uniref:Peptidoglycan DD-metalloendopeptidase family protein n=1 Tax=Frigidibacter albus TaxID=1465486 RepID=A0A6L8VJC2_9RHOB|nr:M23 family metallopeptidase [Frigidibacter albus]MZQ89816.1 peptidoglycan DD-metalloendopeptidase family protein [Frigidibacter albus]NBE31809.1 peptidoglycan DD-metalloendopeptidase family protein [Frigidibacter albus]GGH56520.1 peptidase M23 [Frigidibacter albus]
MPKRILHRVNTALGRHLPEQRLFLRSDTETRFIRLRPLTQALVLSSGGLVLAWTIIATAILLMDSIGSGSARDQAARKQSVYETRLDTIARERDARAEEALAAQERFAVALQQVSTMQSALLDSEERRRELETGIDVIQTTLRRTMTERDAARTEAKVASAALAGEVEATGLARTGDLVATLDILSDTLGETAAERDAKIAEADASRAETETIAYEKRLMEERNDEIFNALEDAITVSMDPLDKVFKSAGLNPDDLISQVQSGYSGQGGPWTPIAMSAKNDPTASAEEARAARLLEGFDRLNVYRIAAERVPLAMPLQSAFRFTSPFGQRWGRLHAGIDFAGAYGSPIYATADGVVSHAGWMSGYGRLVTIKHQFGIETRYGHMAQIRVKAGDRVSRGDRIGDMGNSGRSTGTHLHYEVRTGGTPVNPMTFIKAGRDVF